MKVMILFISLLSSINLYAYTQEDWRVYDACKERVYDGKKNGYDHEACQEMLNHKKALKKHGAESSYNYWMKRLGKN
jgi:hypothetical protein